MLKVILHALVITSLCWLTAPVVLALEAPLGFADWLQQLRADALSAGVSTETLNAALADIEEPQLRVLDSDLNQPEKTQTLEDYITTRVTAERIAEGRLVLRRYSTWLGRIERQYGVQKRFLVSLWGIESNYGRQKGQIPSFQALVTLAYDDRRGEYFRKELLEALRILQTEHVTLREMKGSWAGAMGHFQFMPSTYRHYAVDADGDGRRDIWNSIPDALASAANYLAKAGWKNDQTWGRPVKLPGIFDNSLAGGETRLTLAGWQALGVRRYNGGALPNRDLLASLIISEEPSASAYLVYSNFHVLRKWNRSNAFAVAVGTLADSFAIQN